MVPQARGQPAINDTQRVVDSVSKMGNACMGSNLTVVAIFSPAGLPEKCCAKVRIVSRRGAADASARHPSTTLVLMTSSTPWWSGVKAMPPLSVNATVVMKMPCVPSVERLPQPGQLCTRVSHCDKPPARGVLVQTPRHRPL